MIPKVIHYCWFGKGPLPPLALKCIRSWEKYCPDYRIVCHNEENSPWRENRYAREAMEAKKWAFVSDYARLKILFDEGGIYFDTDVELLRPLDDLIQTEGFMGFDDKGLLATGLGFACEKGNPLVGEMLKDYDTIPFLLEDGYDLTPCPNRNTLAAKRVGLGEGEQSLLGIHLYPAEYFCPMEYETGKIRKTKNTYSIHRFSASWTSKSAKRTLFLKRLLGVALYNKLYGKFLHHFKGLEW